MSWVEVAYRHLPVWLQNAAVSAYGVMWQRRRFGPGFEAALRAAKERESFSAEAWRRYQTERLRQLMRVALTSVPYYRDVYRGLGLTEDRIERFTLEELTGLPLVGKQEIRPAPRRFVSEQAGTLHTYLTSGSTGTPLAVYMSPRTRRHWQALYEARCVNWAGVHRRMSRAMIGGRLVVPRGVARPPFWRTNRVERQLYLSAFHIAPTTTADYLAAIDAFAPAYLAGYASAWFILSRFAQEQGRAARPVKAILTSSEKLEPFMRETMEGVFGGPVFDAYSGVEACCLASECEYHRLHVSPDAGIVEILDDDGQPVAPGKAGEIVATGLVNLDQPLIRYRTGDVASWSAEACPCGRAMPVLAALEGRLEDVVIGPDGRETVRFHGLYVGLQGIMEGQVVQEALDRIVILVVPGPNFRPREAEEIQRRVRARLGEVSVRVEPVERIERTAAGKFKAVISHVRRNPP